MTQNRKPPAYQEYAATLLADKKFRLMSLAERGLLWTIKLECWENHDLPANPQELAKYLGLDVEQLTKALTERVKSFLFEKHGVFTCPELEDYRAHITERRTKQSKGGKKGAAKVNAANKAAKQLASHSTGNSSSTPQVACESLVKHSSVKQSQDQSAIKGNQDEWLNDYNNYDQASNGH